MESETEGAAIVWAWITFVNLLLPITLIFRCCTKGNSAEIEHFFGNTPDFRNVAHTFVTDYDRANPVTANEAEEFYRKLI